MDFRILLFIITGALLLYACYTDLTSRRISNVVSLLVMVLSLIAGFLNIEGPSFLFSGCVLIAGFFLSLVGVIGAGDIKLAAALVLGLSTQDGSDFLLLSGFAGVPVSLITLLYYRVRKQGNKVSVPYGIAIASGYFLQALLR